MLLLGKSVKQTTNKILLDLKENPANISFRGIKDIHYNLYKLLKIISNNSAFLTKKQNKIQLLIPVVRKESVLLIFFLKEEDVKRIWSLLS